MDLEFVQKQLVACNTKFHEDPEENTACAVNFINPSESQEENPEILIWNKALSGRDEKQCSESSQFYLQSPCIVREHHVKPLADGKKEFPNMQKRQVFGLMVGSLGVFVYLFTVIYIDYIKQVQKNKFLDFDVKTITAGDYSVEFDIDESVYSKWKNHYNMESNPMSEMAQFKIYIQNKLEERISAMDDLGYDGVW
jgi:hypothetical protein